MPNLPNIFLYNHSNGIVKFNSNLFVPYRAQKKCKQHSTYLN